MKKIVLILLSLVMLVSLTACGGGDDAATDTDSGGDAGSGDKIVIRLGTATEEEGGYVQGARVFAEKVDEYTDGKVEVQIFPSSQLGNERDLIEGVGLGTLEMTVSSTGPLPNFSEDFMVFDLPYIISDREKAYEVMDGEIGQEILGTLEPMGIKALGFWENGFRHISNADKEIVTPEDLSGMKIRTMENPIHMDTFEHFEAMPTPMAWGEVFTALQQGTVDGQENPLIIFSTNKLSEAQDYLSMTGHFYSPAVIMINQAAFEGYPEDVQEAILKAEEEAREWERQFSIDQDNTLLDEIKAEGVTVTEVDRDAWQKACQPIYEMYEDRINQDYVNALLGN